MIKFSNSILVRADIPAPDAGLTVDVLSKNTGKIFSGIQRIVFCHILQVKIFTAGGQIGKNHPVAGTRIGIVRSRAVDQRTAAGGGAVRGDVVFGVSRIEATGIGRTCVS